MTFAVAGHVIGVVITSSPGPTPSASSERCIAAVPEETASACFAPDVLGEPALQLGRVAGRSSASPSAASRRRPRSPPRRSRAAGSRGTRRGPRRSRRARGSRQRESVRVSPPASRVRAPPRGSRRRRARRRRGRTRAAAARSRQPGWRYTRTHATPSRPRARSTPSTAPTAPSGGRRGTARTRRRQRRRGEARHSESRSPRAAASASPLRSTPSAASQSSASCPPPSRAASSHDTGPSVAEQHLRVRRPVANAERRGGRRAQPATAASTSAGALARPDVGERDAERGRLGDDAVGHGERDERAADGEGVDRQLRPVDELLDEHDRPARRARAPARTPPRARPGRARATGRAGPGGRAP